MESQKKARLPFLEGERLIRLLLSFLLFLGCYLPLVMALGAKSGILFGLLLGSGLLLAFTVLGSFRHSRYYVAGFLVLLGAVQFVLPSQGLIGSYREAVKAITFTLNGLPAAASMFARPIALLIGSLLPILCYLFSNRTVAFLPAAILVTLMLFALCALGESGYLWMTAPAFMGVLLIISRAQHDRMHLPEVLPVVTLVVAFSLLLLPAGQTVLKPLYDQAMELKQRISDYLFFNDEREIFSIGSYGWYPDMKTNGHMGGDVTPDENPVMMVKTSKRILLRGISKDRYDGVDWDNTFDMARYQYRLSRYQSLRESIFGEKLPDETLSGSSVLSTKAVNIQMMNQAASTVFTPVTLRSASNLGSMVLYFNERGELFTTHNLEQDEMYTVFAPIFEGGDTELNRLMEAFPQSGRTQDSAFYSRYLQLPDHLEEKFYQDVENIIRGYSTAYDKARAIVRHLNKYCSYTLTPGPAPENYDFVTYFLYSGKCGYSVHFASALTVMCRMAGIPARYVEGFIANPAEDGFAYVTGRDARAWCEIWVEGFGWIPFDATRDEENSMDPPPQTQPEQTPTPTPPPQDSPTPAPDPNEIPLENENTPTPPPPEDDSPEDEDKPPFPWLAGLILLLVLLLIAAAVLRFRQTDVHHMAKHSVSHTDGVFIYGAAVLQLAAMKGLKLQKGEAPLHFARRGDAAGVLPTAILPLWQMMCAARYGGAQLTERAEKESENTFRVIWKAQGLWIRLCFRVKNALRRHPYEELTTHAVYERPVSLYPALGSAKKPGSRAAAEAERKRYARPQGERPPDMPPVDEPEGDFSPAIPENRSESLHRRRRGG